MAITFRFDRVDGNAAKLTEKGWESLVRIVTVSGLDAPNGYDRIHQAVQALFVQEGIVIGSPHPAEPSAFLKSISPESMDPQQLVMKLEYKSAPFPLSNIRIGGTVTQVENNVDSAGIDVILFYSYPEDYPEQERAGTTEETGVKMPKLIQQIGVTITRQEYFDLDGLTPINHRILLNRSIFFQGHINSTVWNVDPDGAIGTWMCSSLEADTQDGGHSYSVVYKFLYRSPDWKEPVVFNDPNTNKPVPDLTDPQSKQRVQQYTGVDFNVLNL
jgi:hypothetical protein